MASDGEELAEEAFQFATATVMSSSKMVRLNPERIAELVAAFPERFSETPSLTLPLRFDRSSEEVNFCCLLYLLRFGAFFRDHIGSICGNAPSMYEHSLRGVLSLFLQGKLDADRLINITITDVEAAFLLPLSREERLENMPAFINVEAPTKQFASDIVKVLHETGRLLHTHRVASLGDYVMNFLVSHHCDAAAISAQDLVLDLASTFPAFNDKPFYGNACALVRTLYWTFKDRIPVMRFRHMSKLCPDSDSEMIDFFYDRGIIEVKGDPNKVPIVVLRSAVIVAVRQLQLNLQSSRELSMSVVEIVAILDEMHQSDVKAATRDGSSPDRPYRIPASFYL